MYTVQVNYVMLFTYPLTTNNNNKNLLKVRIDYNNTHAQPLTDMKKE